MFTKHWWKAVADRAIRTAAQAFIALTGSDTLGWLNLNWRHIAVGVAMMTALSVATSIATTGVGPDKQDPSIV